jgi:hypothetical protein
MTYEHPQLAAGRWAKFSFCEQMANIGSEVERAISWRKKGNQEYSQKAFFRALELVSISIDVHLGNRSKLKELTRLQEFLGDYFVGDNLYKSSDRLWQSYFYAFNFAARSGK